MKRRALFSIWLTAIWSFLCLLLFAGTTYAWFTFKPYTNVEPMSGTVSGGDVSLLICDTPDGEFDTSCTLPKNTSDGMLPVSTSGLEHFYKAMSRDKDGITLTYNDASADYIESLIHGTVYLKSLRSLCDVYLNQADLSFGEDPQLLAALRLGLRFRTKEGVKQYIFQLDSMGTVAEAVGAFTTAEQNVVVQAIQGNGTPIYLADPAESMVPYFAGEDRDKPDTPTAGQRALCRIEEEEVVPVEYWLYLEGCDYNCINEVQSREVSLQLSFAGVTGRR